MIAATVAITAVASPLVTAGDDRRVLRNTIVPPFDPKDYITPLASFRNFVKDKKDDNLFVVKGLPKDARVRLAALDAFNGTNYNMDPNGSGSFSKVGDAKSINTLADSTGIVPSNDYTLDITIEDYQGYFLPGGRKTTGISFARDGSGAASGLYFNAGTDTAVTTKGLAKGDSYSVQVADPAKLEHGQLTQYDFAKVSLPDAAEVPPVVGSQANDLSADAPTAIDRVRQIEAHFQKKGAFSNGLIADGQLPSVSGHGANRIREPADRQADARRRRAVRRRDVPDAAPPRHPVPRGDGLLPGSQEPGKRRRRSEDHRQGRPRLGGSRLRPGGLGDLRPHPAQGQRARSRRTRRTSPSPSRRCCSRRPRRRSRRTCRRTPHRMRWTRTRRRTTPGCSGVPSSRPSASRSSRSGSWRCRCC